MQVSFKGTGTAPPDPTVLGTGQGLQVGVTEIDFEAGTVSLVSNTGQPTNIGKFSGLRAIDAANVLKSLVFKANISCTVVIDQNYYDYDTVNQYVTFNRLEVSRIKIIRTPSGQNPDVFDWLVIGSDDPEYKFSIQASNKQSTPEVVFQSQSYAVNTYTQTTNMRGAKKAILTLKTANLSETGLVTITAEIFDTASQSWIPHIPSSDLFNAIGANQTKRVQIGDDIIMPPNIDNTYYLISATVGVQNPVVVADGNIVGESLSNGISAVSVISYLLPSGDNILRFKAVVATSSLTFSLGIIKVFD